MGQYAKMSRMDEKGNFTLWNSQYQRDLAGREIEEITTNLTGFFSLLKEWDDKNNMKEDEMNENGNFETTDLPLVAVLRLQGFTIKDIRRDGKRAIFILEDKPKRQEIVRNFYNDAISISPLKFWNSVADVKALIYNY